VQKGAAWGYAIAGFIAIGLIGNVLNPTGDSSSPSPSTSNSVEVPSSKLSPNPDAAPPSPTVSPFDPSYVDSADEALLVEDLGEGACTIYEVCTFVNVKVQIDGGCSLGQVFIELFNADDEPYFEEAVDLGTVSKGQVLKFIEVGTNDSDAEYVEVGGYNCQ
jgi:hypothetical protein